MKIELDPEDVLKGVDTLRDFIRKVWKQLAAKEAKLSDALEAFDLLYDRELRGQFRGEMMDILDKASARVGGGDPTLTESDPYDKVVPLPKTGERNQITSPDEDQPTKNIIQMRRA